MLRRALFLLGIIFLSGCTITTTYTNSNSEKIQVTEGEKSIQVELAGASSREEATNQITNALAGEGYRMAESNAQAGVVQTEPREVGADAIGSVAAKIRLNIVLENSSSAVVEGQYDAPVSREPDLETSITFGHSPGSKPATAWNHMLKAAAKIGTVTDFKR